MKIRFVISMMLSFLLATGLCLDQQGWGKTKQDKIFQRSVPSILSSQHKALGKRMKDKGKERTEYIGIIIDAAGNEIPARIIHQLPNLVRVEGLKGRNQALSFDGERANGISSKKSDEALLELFVMDLAEGMLASVQESAAVRFLGSGFGPDPRTNPDYTGPRYDIYEITAPAKGLETETVRTKKYYFDSETKLLLSTRYNDYSNTPPTRIETRFAYSRNIDESAYPIQIERFENGKRVFAFIAESIESGVPLDKESFR